MQDLVVVLLSVKLKGNWCHSHRIGLIKSETGLDSILKSGFLKEGSRRSRIVWKIDKKPAPLTQGRSHCIRKWFTVLFKMWFFEYMIPL